ncbi:MAG: hypothetical protein PHW15_03490 [Patescibacteria group bacterium]|nr:hypothetical protein [Patescibacteria group bacterium]
MTKNEAFDLQPDEVAVKLKKSDIQLIQIALSFQRDEILKSHKRLIEVGIPFNKFENILENADEILYLSNRLEESIL